MRSGAPKGRRGRVFITGHSERVLARLEDEKAGLRGREARPCTHQEGDDQQSGATFILALLTACEGPLAAACSRLGQPQKKGRKGRPGVARRLAANPDATREIYAETCSCGAPLSPANQPHVFAYDHHQYVCLIFRQGQVGSTLASLATCYPSPAAGRATSTVRSTVIRHASPERSHSSAEQCVRKHRPNEPPIIRPRSPSGSFSLAAPQKYRQNVTDVTDARTSRMPDVPQSLIQPTGVCHGSSR